MHGAREAQDPQRVCGVQGLQVVQATRGLLLLRSRKGQMAVELAVCLPIVMAVLAIAFNLMVFLGDCARFDRLAAEVVRTRATSPSASSYGLGACEYMVGLDLNELFDTEDRHLRTTVDASAVLPNGATDSGGDGVSIPLLPHHEVYVCTLEYRPWGFGTRFLGFELPGITHTRSFTVDPFRPGVLL
ncbi:MAG: hypothetical protein LBP24_00865 [Coriobacteriales bacterium]|jgi:hypothetical protein|nr:hypothetical protein [Coriobacteriales bacterium]